MPIELVASHYAYYKQKLKNVPFDRVVDDYDRRHPVAQSVPSRTWWRNTVTMVVLREMVEVPEEADTFKVKRVEQVRVLRLVQAGPATMQQGGAHGVTRPTEWRYVVEVWQKNPADTSADWVMVELRTPSRRGKPLPLIPFVFHAPRNALPDVDKMPLAEIIYVNLDHYRLDADYKHGLHFTALPTAWVSGFDKESELRIGSSTAWVSDTVGAVAGFLEFKGHGVSTFENAQDRDERLMAVLGSRMLEDTKRVGETADAIELRLKAVLTVFGCDPKLFTFSQPVRVPGAFRDGRLQRIVWLKD